jgi:hypothetical protein
LNLLHADLQLGADIHELQRRSKSLLVPAGMPNDYRVRAAVAAVALADHACAVDEIRDVHRLTRDALNGRDVDVAQRATINMIYHVSCGDLDQAAEASRTLLEVRYAAGSARDIVHALRCAARVSRYCGDWTAATTYLKDAVVLAERNRLATQATRACGMLAEQAFARLDFVEATEWHSRAVGWTRATDDRLLGAVNELFAAQLALAEGRLDAARSSLSSRRIQDLRSTLYAGRIEALAVELHLHVASGELAAVRSLFPEFERVFEQLLPFGDLDYAAVVRYLCSSDDDAAGHAHLVAYATTLRRERGRLSPLLATPVETRVSPFHLKRT